MASESIITAIDIPARKWRALPTWAILSDYWSLTKPEVNFLIAITTAAGFYLGLSVPHLAFPWKLFVHTVLGTILVASGTGTLNQWMEYRYDSQMRRTARRPVAAGRIKPIGALVFGVLVSAVGVTYLALSANLLAASLALFTLTSYLLLYTPSKRITPLCTLIGTVPGAMPPLIGWAAARGHLDFGAWLLFAIVFLWQFPHFMAIAWMYREDYARASYLVLPHDHSREHFVEVQTLLPLVALTLVPFSGGQFSALCRTGATLLSLGFLYYAARFLICRSNSAARRLLIASIIYLPSLFVWIVLSKG